MTKINKISLGLLSLESIILAVLYFFFQNPCGSPCDTHSLLNPFGIMPKPPEICAPFCAQTLHPLTYLITDLLIITMVFYTLFFLYHKIKGRR